LLRVAPAADGAPGRGPDDTQGLVGPFDDVEGVGALDCGRASLGDHVADPGGRIGRDMGDLAAAMLAEIVEEPAQGGPVSSRFGPHQPAGVVVDHHG
jgi:hypothetical protein